jgi:hypothetical protein
MRDDTTSCARAQSRAGFLSIFLLFSVALALVPCGGLAADATPVLAAVPRVTIPAEDVYLCLLYGPDPIPVVRANLLLKKIGAKPSGAVWKYTNAQGRSFVIHFVADFPGMLTALYTPDAHVIVKGHSNYGMGGVFASSIEMKKQVVTAIRTIDDERILTYSSPWVAVNVNKCLGNQAFPNWWPIYKDGTSGIMPYTFDDPRGAPAYNYYLTYTVPDDPTLYKVETVRNGALERFSESKRPAWYSPSGALPDSSNPADQPYFIVNTNHAFETVGKWLQDSTGTGYYGRDCLTATAGTGASQAAWNFSLSTAGTYNVMARWKGSVKNATKATYAVTHALGTTGVAVNQRINGGTWVSLGSFSFDVGDYSVALTDAATPARSTVVADAIRIVGPPETGPLDRIIDNTGCPKSHLAGIAATRWGGNKTIIARKALEIDSTRLAYSRMFYEGCNTGIYFIDTFHRGLMFYTVNDSDMSGFDTYVERYLKGDSDAAIWTAMQKVQAVYDYYDFTKPPSQQPGVPQPAVSAGALQTRAIVGAASAPALTPDEAALGRALARLSVVQALNRLTRADFVGDDFVPQAVLSIAFGDRRAEAVAAAVRWIQRPTRKTGWGTATSSVREQIAAAAVLKAFPDESSGALVELYLGGDATVRGNVVRAAGAISFNPVLHELLVAALEDASPCEEGGADSVGEPMRVCDAAYNQLVLWDNLTDCLRVIGPAHRLEVRDYHIALLQKRLNAGK